MENFEVILSLVVTTVGFIASTITFLVKYIKTHFAKKNAEHHIAIRDVLLGFIHEAEKILDKTGEEKKAFVMTKIQEYAESKNLKYDMSHIGNVIDEIVNLTKLVNTLKAGTKK